MPGDTAFTISPACIHTLESQSLLPTISGDSTRQGPSPQGSSGAPPHPDVHRHNAPYSLDSKSSPHPGVPTCDCQAPLPSPTLCCHIRFSSITAGGTAGGSITIRITACACWLKAKKRSLDSVVVVVVVVVVVAGAMLPRSAPSERCLCSLRALSPDT